MKCAPIADKVVTQQVCFLSGSYPLSEPLFRSARIRQRSTFHKLGTSPQDFKAEGGQTKIVKVDLIRIGNKYYDLVLPQSTMTKDESESKTNLLHEE